MHVLAKGLGENKQANKQMSMQINKSDNMKSTANASNKQNRGIHMCHIESCTPTFYGFLWRIRMQVDSLIDSSSFDKHRTGRRNMKNATTS